jgi:hypothetical protein
MNKLKLEFVFDDMSESNSYFERQIFRLGTISDSFEYSSWSSKLEPSKAEKYKVQSSCSVLALNSLGEVIGRINGPFTTNLLSNFIQSMKKGEEV